MPDHLMLCPKDPSALEILWSLKSWFLQSPSLFMVPFARMSGGPPHAYLLAQKITKGGKRMLNPDGGNRALVIGF